MFQSKIQEKFESKTVVLWDIEVPENEAKFAMSMIERWGMVAGIEDGEDGAKRQKLRLATPEELVKRAFEVASITFKTIRDEGLMHITPDLPGQLHEEPE